jgi:hypothetical protein
MQNSLSLDAAGSVILGAGIAQIGTDLVTSLILIGVGVVLKLLISVLHKYDFQVSTGLEG